jgi:CHASE2 domain-containing sensor protein
MASRARTARRPHLLIALGVIALIGAIWYIAPGFLHTIEFNLYNEHFRLRGRRAPNPQVAIVTIDEPSLAVVGHWPWPRTVLARLVQRLDKAGAASIAFDVLLNEPDPWPEREFGNRLRQRLDARGLDASGRAVLEKMVAEADHDAALAGAIRDSGRVVLSSNFFFGGSTSTDVPERTGSPMKSALGVRQTEKHIIISEGAYEAAGDAIEVRRLGEVKVKGKTRPVVIYELLGLTATPEPNGARLS